MYVLVSQIPTPPYHPPSPFQAGLPHSTQSMPLHRSPTYPAAPSPGPLLWLFRALPSGPLWDPRERLNRDWTIRDPPAVPPGLLRTPLGPPAASLEPLLKPFGTLPLRANLAGLCPAGAWGWPGPSPGISSRKCKIVFDFPRQIVFNFLKPLKLGSPPPKKKHIIKKT